MPRIYRPMHQDARVTGKPRIGCTSCLLGVRVPPDSHCDVRPDSGGVVAPGTGGMSVRDSWRSLPFFLIPRRLVALVPGARGNPKLHVFAMGSGAFGAGPLNESLVVRPDSNGHGLVEPRDAVHVESFQAALAQTQADWEVDEA